MNEKIKSPGRWLILTAALLVLTLAVAAGIGGTRADPESGANLQVSLTESTSTGRIIPGFSQKNDPKVTVTSNADCYLFMKIRDGGAGAIKWEIAEGWTALTGVSGLAENESLYYRDVNGEATEKTFSILKNGSVSYPAELGTSAQNGELGFTAYVISKTDHVEAGASSGTGQALSDPTTAWNTILANPSPAP